MDVMIHEEVEHVKIYQNDLQQRKVRMLDGQTKMASYRASQSVMTEVSVTLLCFLFLFLINITISLTQTLG